MTNEIESKKIVEDYNRIIESITTIHKIPPNNIDWEEISKQQDYSLDDIGPNQQIVMDELNNYKPTFRDKLFNRVEARKRIIKEKLEDAKVLDLKHFRELNEKKELAIKILENDFEAWDKAFSTFHTFNTENFFNNKLSLVITEDQQVTIKITVNNQDIVPKEILSLTKTNKLSRKNMPKGKYYELYNKYICSSTFAAARQAFAILPIDLLTLNVYDNSQADPLTYKGCILSARFPREQFELINFNTVDCSLEIHNFEHNMKHLKTKGFRFVEELK